MMNVEEFALLMETVHPDEQHRVHAEMERGWTAEEAVRRVQGDKDVEPRELDVPF